MYRKFVITGESDVNDSEEWQEVVGDRTLLYATFAEFGLAEEVLALLVFDDPETDKYVAEVGIGESMRSYNRIVVGDFEEASHIFIKTLLRLSVGEPFANLFDSFEEEAEDIRKLLERLEEKKGG